MISLEEAILLKDQNIDFKSVGELSEHSLHRTIKFMIEPDSSFHEVNLLGKIVDIYNKEGIFEIQTKSFKKLIDKLEILLPSYKITIVYPFVVEKMINMSDNSKTLSRRKSPKKNPLINSLLELFYIRDYLLNDNLTINVISLKGEEFRKSAKNRSGKVVEDFIPTEIVSSHLFYKKEDYSFLIESLPNEFDANDVRKLTKFNSYKNSFIIYTLLSLGLIKKDHKDSRKIIYKKEIE